jgi:DNA-directed RNA polymerase specialized sigma subunit
MAYINDPYFKTFANKLSSEIKSYGEVPKDKEGLLAYQKKQMEELFSLEKKFRKTLIKNRRGVKIYGEFIHYITKEKKNILVARPFFRERHEVFNKISKALKENRPKSLFKYKVNYNFIMFALEKMKLSPKHELVQIKDRIEQLRTDLVILNMPLAINRSKRFFSKTPTSHLTYMDIIQISTEGLLAAIDKFVPPFSSTFRAVIIGRITGENIFSYSQTLLHFYPIDRRRLYNANKIAHKHRVLGAHNFEDISNELNNTGMLGDITVTPDEIASLMSAASTVSADSSSSVSEEQSVKVSVSRFAAPEDVSPETQVEKAQLIDNLKDAMGGLSSYELKILQLKGVSLENLQ